MSRTSCNVSWRCCAASGAREWSTARALSSSSLRAQRSNPESFGGGILDCFVARAPRNDGARGNSAVLHAQTNRRHALAFSRRISPELCLVSLPSKSKRAQGRPGAGWHPRSAARKARAKKTAQQHTGVADHSAFPARWLDGLCRDLPGADHSFWPPSPRELDDAVCPVGLARTFAKDLTVATTVRTTRFCRTHGPPCRRSFSSPVDEAGNLQTRRSLAAPSSARGYGLTGTTRPARTFHADAAASTATPAREHDDDTSPLLVSRDGRHIRRNRISVKWNIFMRVD